MSLLSSSLRRLVAPFAFLLGAGVASAQVILNDTMSRASRTAAPTATGAQWFSTGPASGIAATVSYVQNSELKVTSSSTTNTGAQLLGYLTLAGSPVTLAENKSVKATFTFSLVGSFGSTTGSTSFRIGLFNSGGQRIAGDLTGASSSTFINYAGYAAMMSPTTSGISIFERIPPAPGTTVSNQTNLIGTNTGIYSATPLASGSSQSLQANVNYTGVLIASRTAAGVEFSFSLSGPGLTSYSLSGIDTASTVVSFDSIAFGWSNGVVLAGGGLAVRGLTLEVGDAAPPPPPPPPPPYTGRDPLANPDPGRPFIWVRESEKTAILNKIATQPWAQSVMTTLQNRVAANIARHQTDRDVFLRELPVTWSTSTPTFKTMTTSTPFSEVRGPAVAKFDLGLDSAILYYLTGDATYAQCAADILYNAIKTLKPVVPATDPGNGGWIVRNDLLLEARILGTQLPMMYDFLRPYLETNKVYDVQSASLVDFDYLDAQEIFRTYYELTRDHGSRNSNWSALMATCMLQNLLALSDPVERAAALKIYLTTGSDRQASLSYDYRHYQEAGNVWPESLQYANEVVTIRSTHMVLLERYDPTLKLFDTYPNYVMSLPRLSYLRFPNRDLVSFGDGPRPAEAEPFFEYEVIYQHAKATQRSDLVAFFGARIATGVEDGTHRRNVLPGYTALGMHNELVQLLWFAEEVTEPAAPLVLPQTDRLPFAGIALQRNPSTVDNERYGLMGFVGGAGHIHSHASGMSMELYGAGEVLGAKSGKGTYQTADHENYYRVFASNNTIVVNGASRGQGGWENIGINTVRLEAIEPAVFTAPVSPFHSFTSSSFLDDKGTLAEATQQRTLGIVRTSPTTGYYVDIFRSDSALANEYHDYIYRNLGDTVSLHADEAPLPLASAPDRFQTDIGDEYKQPGWRYFTDTEVSAATSSSVRARFTANDLPAGPTHMEMFMPGSADREYARVSSPRILQAASPYHSRRAPTVVIRKQGSAWDQPFAAIYEPYVGVEGSGSVKSVEKIERDGVVVGLKVLSTVGGANLVQYVLSNPNADDVYEDPAIGLYFKGRYAVVTDKGDGTGSLYLGQGSRLAFLGNSVSSPDGTATEAYMEFAAGQVPSVTSNRTVHVTTPPTLTASGVAAGTFGTPFSLAVTTTGIPAPVLSLTSALPPGLEFDPATGLLGGVPAAAGEYALTFVATNAAGSATANTLVSIGKAQASVTLHDLEQTYTGVARSASVVTSPADLPVIVTYAGGGEPVNAGTYPVIATVNHANYAGFAQATFVINKAAASVTLSDLSQRYDGTPRVVTVDTAPSDLNVAITYDGATAAPIYPGSYPIVAVIDEPNHEGMAAGTLEVAITARVRHLPSLNGGVDGSVQVLVPGGVAMNSAAYVSGDLLVPGTPAVVLNGSAVLGGIIDGPGAEGPSDSSVVLNSAVVRAVVRRIDPGLLPTVEDPPLPAGTVDASIGSKGGTIDFASLRNLSLGANAGVVVVPPGTYGSFTAGRSSGFVLGVPGAEVPAVYNLQALNLYAGSRLEIVGPVILTLKNGTSISRDVTTTAHPYQWLVLRIASGGLAINGGLRLPAIVQAPAGTVSLYGTSSIAGEVHADRLSVESNAVITEPAAP